MNLFNIGNVSRILCSLEDQIFTIVIATKKTHNYLPTHKKKKKNDTCT